MQKDAEQNKRVCHPQAEHQKSMAFLLDRDNFRKNVVNSLNRNFQHLSSLQRSKNTQSTKVLSWVLFFWVPEKPSRLV